ncbi:uncharacterized protein K489DRAFT_381032 [Dissoconium aciculare CBS 342.82]|uniref:AMP-activated protein kinase glycogen-binding domain-containing protein n=1 Tax=Dissoconium aciculare CBS 342.82 TaxID=1314786 RepID=A0A6J3M312_9PEZI|nr:uncharacterized protein K489DRAFT_381032 [Dissoconium aciculare CBS 342.82]KAF1822283.1 hypothetical protein K489DRAFT_381032 [Dissoconium aciculare CBS 342.82]
MKLPITIGFTSPGLQPPVYICSTLTNPQWDAVEMDVTRNEKGEYRFRKTFTVDEGDYQYKFRLGPGDWWATDDGKPTVDDGMGNKNNMIVVKEQSKQVTDTPVMISSLSDSKSQSAVSNPINTTPVLVEKLARPHNDVAMEHSAPKVLPSATSDIESMWSSEPPEDANDEPECPPLLLHETVVPSSFEQDQAPLFRHETATIKNVQHEVVRHEETSPDSGEPSCDNGPVIPHEANLMDKTLQKFLTDVEWIREELASVDRRASGDTSAEHALSDNAMMTDSDDQLDHISEGDDDESGTQDQLAGKSYGTFERAVVSQGQMTPPLTPKCPAEEGFKQDKKREPDTLADSSKPGAIQPDHKKAHHHSHESLISIVLVAIGCVIAVVTVVFGVFFVVQDDSAVLAEH